MISDMLDTHRWKKRLLTNSILAVPLAILCIAVLNYGALPYDKALRQWTDSMTIPLLEGFFKAFYYLGDTVPAAMVVIISGLILIVKRRFPQMWLLGFATLGVLIMVDLILKPSFAIDRPGHDLKFVFGYSFPSGHTTGNLTLYMMLAYIYSQLQGIAKKWPYVLASAIAIMIGLASVYSGVHRLSDVIAGYGFGFMWWSFCITIYEWRQQRKRLKNSD